MPSSSKSARSHSHPRESESVREDLLAAARRLFAAKGFEGVSVKDLARETGHNAALVSYYFGSKEGLYRECVMPLLGAGMANAKAILRSPKCRQDFLARFDLFVENFISTHLVEQDICMILSRDCHTDVVKQLFKDHVLCLDDTVHCFLEDSRKEGFVRDNIDLDLLAKVVVSSLFHLITGDRFLQDLGETTFLNPQRRASTIRQMSALLLQGFLTPQ